MISHEIGLKKSIWVIVVTAVFGITTITCGSTSNDSASFPGAYVSFDDVLYLQSDLIDESAVGEAIGHTSAFPCRWTDTSAPFKPGDGPGLEEGLAVMTINGSDPSDQIAIKVNRRMFRFNYWGEDC